MPDAFENYQMTGSRQEEMKRTETSTYANTFSSAPPNRRDPGAPGSDMLSIALIGPDEGRRKELANNLAGFRGGEVREFSSYPPALHDVPRLLEQYYDVIIIDLDADLEYALELVESICAKDSATVMVYSGKADQELVFRCMRAGAREFFFPPFDQSTIVEALIRASIVVRPANRPAKKTRGRLQVFLGAKGGSGVTTIACNFAIGLGQESAQSTLLIDLGLPMGDAALNLGIVTDYSTDNALEDADRLDATFLSHLLVKHRSGISVLAAPSKVPRIQASTEAIDKLMKAARQEFENVVVDVGSRLDLMGTALFKDASTIYLITQAGISELRNSNRVISEYFNQGTPKLEIVINRYEARALGLSDDHIGKALDRPVQWKIPDDYAAVRQMQNSATPLTLADSPISRVIRQMARASCGLPPVQEKAGFRLRNLGRNIAEKMSASEEAPTIADAPQASGAPATIAWSAPAPIVYGTKLTSTQLDASASAPGTFVYTPGTGYVLPAGTHTLWVTFTSLDNPNSTPVQAAAPITVNKATPAVNWATPPGIPCGTALSDAQLNATASLAGNFVYTPAAGEVLGAGKHKLSVAFSPTDSANYNAAQATVSVTVAKATPAMSWAAPAQINSGTALGDAQLNATASVPGTFVYTPAPGEVLSAGRHRLSVTFNPADSAGYNTAQATVELTVTRATPAISWPAPATMAYGARLSGAQLCATASVAGSFAYTPEEGAMLTAGTHRPTVTFTPADGNDYTTAHAASSLTVVAAEPEIGWETPTSISEGTPLTSLQLNAEALVPGSFVYTPAIGEILPAGTHSLTLTFTPMDSVNYTAVEVTRSIAVIKAQPVSISWQNPFTISYGTALSETQLNATTSVPGVFVYSPEAGDVLPAGKHKLCVSFTPQDRAEYSTTQAAVVIEVEELPEVSSPPADGRDLPFMTHGNEEYAGFDDTNHEAFLRSETISHIDGIETRVYKGATYEKGEDGKWHLQRK